MIKLIASDLDGTLLQNGAQELTPRAIDLIHRISYIRKFRKSPDGLWWSYVMGMVSLMQWWKCVERRRGESWERWEMS